MRSFILDGLKSESNKIVGGSVSIPNSWPWFVSFFNLCINHSLKNKMILIKRQVTMVYKGLPFCGATLINEQVFFSYQFNLLVFFLKFLYFNILIKQWILSAAQCLL
jgi:hypothetical protein